MQCRWVRTPIYPCLSRSSSTHAREVVSSLPTPAITLRPYQEQCLAACLDALESGSTRLGVSLPTGSGKTTVFVSLLSRLPPRKDNDQATRSLIVVNSIELARQSALQVQRLFPHWTVEIEQGTKYKATGLADVTVATYQTLNREQRLVKFDPSSIKAVIVDEAHHAAAKSYRALLSRFHPDIKHPDPDVSFDPPLFKTPILGFSATFGRHDGLALGSVFEKIVYHRDFLEMIKEQWLCDVRFTSVKAKINLKDVTINNRNGDFNPTSLAEVVNAQPVNELVVKSWIDRAAGRKSTLVFCVNIAHVKDLTQTFRRHGIDARYLFSETPPAQRKELVDDFKEGKFPVLVNCSILTEGADIPNIDCVILARPTRSRNVFAQMIGRGMRLSPATGKQDCHIIDFVDGNSRVNGVVSIPTLFGLDPNEIDITEETPVSLERKAAEIERNQVELPTSESPSTPAIRGEIPDPTWVLYTDHDDPFGAFAADSKSTHIFSMSNFAWVACGDDIYVLECLQRGYIRIELTEIDGAKVYSGRFVPASWTRKIAYLAGRQILTSDTLEQAIQMADSYATSQIFGHSRTAALLRGARWRHESATEKQKQMIGDRYAKGRTDMTESQREDYVRHLTKGQAANIITRMKHGGHGRLKKLAKKKEREAQVYEKEESRRAREDVKVGYLPV